MRAFYIVESKVFLPFYYGCRPHNFILCLIRRSARRFIWLGPSIILLTCAFMQSLGVAIIHYLVLKSRAYLILCEGRPCNNYTYRVSQRQNAARPQITVKRTKLVYILSIKFIKNVFTVHFCLL